jgi:ribosomal protein S12 methylthiotransferase accessory factor YcaO
MLVNPDCCRLFVNCCRMLDWLGCGLAVVAGVGAEPEFELAACAKAIDDTSEIVVAQNNATVRDGAETDASRKRYARKGRQHAMHAAGLVCCSY